MHAPTPRQTAGPPGATDYALLVLLGAIAAANTSLLQLFYRRKGALFALGGLLFHQVYYLYSSAAFAWCWLDYRISKA